VIAGADPDGTDLAEHPQAVGLIGRRSRFSIWVVFSESVSDSVSRAVRALTIFVSNASSCLRMSCFASPSR
jgi:hypothetical protein